MGGDRLRIREWGVWREYCVNQGKGEKEGGEERSEVVGGSCNCFAGRFSVKRM